MKNYVFIDNQKIELTNEQAKSLKEYLSFPEMKLADIPQGETFKIGKHEFIVLEQSGETTVVIRKDLLPDMEFGSNNDYNGSKVDEACNKFAEEISNAVGEENIVIHTVDLTSNDGMKDYGKVERRCSLITAELYRRYVEILDKFKAGDWWWLSTPFSTKKHENDSWIHCVSPSGGINFHHCHYVGGVRPFCILKSTIFVSK